jgi:hypothetical protein
VQVGAPSLVRTKPNSHQGWCSDPDHVTSTSLAIGADDLDARGRSPMCHQRTRPSLGGEAEGRSLGFILMMAEFAGLDKSGPRHFAHRIARFSAPANSRKRHGIQVSESRRIAATRRLAAVTAGKSGRSYGVSALEHRRCAVTRWPFSARSKRMIAYGPRIRLAFQPQPWTF